MRENADENNTEYEHFLQRATGSRTSQIKLNSKNEPLTKSKNLLKDFVFQMICDVILPSLHRQFYVTSSNFCLA